MFVAVNERLFDPNKEKIMIILSPTDIKNIQMMHKNGNNTYAIYPAGTDKGEIVGWMERKIHEAESKDSKVH